MKKKNVWSLDNENWLYKRGDLYLANLNQWKGSEQGGTRPVVVLQNNMGNIFSPTLIVAPLSTALKKTTQPTHYYIEAATGLPEPSIVELEQIKTIDKIRIVRYMGRVGRKHMKGIERCIEVSLGINIPEYEEAP